MGAMTGDALGMPFEGLSGLVIRARYDFVRDMQPARLERGSYTDGTEMMIGLAEGLLDSPGRLDLDRVALHFRENYNPKRGYDQNTSTILEATSKGMSWRDAVKSLSFPEGSYANGAAMRVAPIVLAFFSNPKEMVRAAAQQAEVTGHTHPLGRFGACLLATTLRRAIVRGAQKIDFDVEDFLRNLKINNQTEYKEALSWIAQNLSASPEQASQHLGTDGVASNSVSIALWSFFSVPDNPEEALLRAINLGGDTDTIGAMTGALAGAYHSSTALPQRWLQALEDNGKGKSYVIDLADKLLDVGLTKK